MTLKAVLFDLGLTLIHTVSFPEIYKRILAKFSVNVSIEDILKAQNSTAAEFDISTYDKNQRKEFWVEYNISLLKKLDIKDKIVFLANQIDKFWWVFSDVQLFPEVEITLSELRTKGLKLGLVSNGFKQDITYVLDKLKLEKWFDSVVCIDSCNCAKPNRQIFLFALDQLQIESDEAIFVGDSISHDYEGALGVGIKPYLIDREGKYSNNYNRINKLTDLFDLL
ncbi:MAG: HAD family hydrolase [Candidatus Bathyarchaeota archaeon]